MTTDFTEIPVIDFGHFSNGTNEEKLKVAKEIGEACRNVGFFYLKNHDVPQQLTKDAFAQAKRYFALPLDVKMKHAMGPPPDGESRGFSPFLTEKFAAKGDYKETFHFALELSKDDPDVKKGAVLYGPNQWPDLPGFREVIYDGYYLAVKELANKLCRAFALALNLPEDYFVSLTDKPMANMSVMWYPPQSRDEPIDPHLLGCGAHTDYGGFTLLQQTENITALQVKNIEGKWIDAKPIEGAFVVNIADTMQRWTNDQFVSTIHRVINLGHNERYSIGLFFGPNYFTNIDCLPTCFDNVKNPKKYKPILAGDFIMSRIVDGHTPKFDEFDLENVPAEQ